MDTGARTLSSSPLLTPPPPLRSPTSRRERQGETPWPIDGRARRGRADPAAPGREEGQGAGQEGAAERGGDPAPLRHRQGDLPLPAQPPGARGPHQRLR